MRLAFLIPLFSAAGSLAAEPFLGLPIACTLGQDCYVEAYVDTDPSEKRADYTCGLRTRDGHTGIDIAIDSYEAMDRGVSVLAAAPGVVAAMRDGLPDLEPSDNFDGEFACGNAVRIAHENGLQTLYCHMRLGSVSVRSGDRVDAGQPIGLVGQSGMTNFPHIHMSVLTAEGGQVDPFAPTAQGTCGETQETLWLDPPAYQKTGFFTAGFSTAVPSLASVTSGDARVLVAGPSDALVIYGHMFHAQHGDVLQFKAHGPQGEVFERSEVLKAPKVNLMRAFGRRAPDAGWPPGIYRSEMTLTRGDTLIAKRYAFVEIE
ncbi:M23 family metallopeptidase [Tropicibacter oceani]|uniref:M23 family metallopeptidase n=1 Tax=Tropicibacter oceani TaxID=3058420 RepID=A0ABY8QJJ1_9RHOB|nr:M23 family metallopeptidase [Tropicibacter oceani]WGW04789.1 M23 family metallopeptidase [Tropicibacter oceani]